MTSRFWKSSLGIAKRILDRIREVTFYRNLDWECISKPLKEDPNDLGRIHNPTIEEYRKSYYVDGKKKDIYDWWYSAILKGKNRRSYFLIVAFHPKGSFYRIIRLNTSHSRENLGSPTEIPTIGKDFDEEVGYSENDDAIDIWIPKSGLPESSEEPSMRCTIKVGESRLILKVAEIAADLTFSSLGSTFWINRGREAICSPRGDKMSGFYDICKVEGLLVDNTLRTEVSGMGINEHLISFTPPKRFWKRVDGIFFCTDQICCTLIYLENKTGKRQYEYKDGAVLLRETKEYLIPVDFEIEYLEIDNAKRVPVKTRILANTTRGQLNVVTQALAETEKQLVTRITDGQFVFKDGRKLVLTNGYGQHALH